MGSLVLRGGLTARHLANNNYEMNLRSTFINILLLMLPLLVGCQQKLDPSNQVNEWSGTVTARLIQSSMGGLDFTSVIVLDTGEKEYAVLHPPGVILLGLTKNGNNVVWEIGKKYQIEGKLVTDSVELEAAQNLGLSQIIMASRIILIDSLGETNTK